MRSDKNRLDDETGLEFPHRSAMSEQWAETLTTFMKDSSDE
jgi:hypothetical protein